MIPLTVEEFFARSGVTHYKKGETILRGGDQPQGVFYIKKGYVRLYSLSKEGEELTLIIFKPGDFFPMIWAINNTSNMYYLESMTPVEVYRAPRDEFVSYIKGEPEVLFELTGRILVRLGGLLQRMEHLAFGNAYDKVASILFICAERFGTSSGKNIVIPLPLTHRDIASLLGITRETVSIEIKKLAEKKIINYKGKHIIVEDLARLRQESSLDD